MESSLNKGKLSEMESSLNKGKLSEMESSLNNNKLSEMESSLTYVKLVSKRGRLEDAVAERKKAELSYMEFEQARLDEIDRLASSPDSIDSVKHQIFTLIFSPPLILSGSLAEESRVHHHIILGPLAPNINLDGRIWKLVNTGQWDVLKKLHRPTLEELCPYKFRSKLDLLWT